MSSYAYPGALVETAWVADHLSDPTIRIFEVDADTAAYEAGHVPGAVGLTWTADLQQPAVRDVISTEQLELLLSRHGVTAETVIVVYGEPRLAASFVWLLAYRGHRQIRLLNGGRATWVAEGRPLVTSVPSHLPTRYVAGQPDRSIRALRDDVLEGIGAEDRVLLDVRSPREFSGELLAPENAPQEGTQRRGRIPGAVNIPWTAALAEDGRFKPVDELREVYATTGAFEANDTIVYCRTGVRSAHTWFVLRYLLGHERTRNYDGSWTEYGSLVGAPIETGSVATPRPGTRHPGRRGPALALAVVMTLVSCGGGTSTAPGVPPTVSATSAPATKKVSIAVPGPNQFMYLAFEVAKGRGDYVREGLEVDITYTRSGTNAVDAVVSGSAIAGAAALDVQIGAVRQGKKLIEIMSITRQPPFALVVNPKASGAIGTVTGLKGKRIAVQNVGSGDYLLATLILAEAGLTAKDVEFLPAGNDDLKVGLLRRGDADAAMLQEPSMLQLRRDGARVLVSFFTTEDARKYLGGMYQFCGLVATQETIEKDPETLARLVRALVSAEKFIRASRGADIVKVLTDEQIVGQNRSDLVEMLDMHKDQIFSPDGIMYENEMEKVIVAQKRSGILPADAVIDVKTLATTRFVKP